MAARFVNRGEQLDDLVQVGTLGLIAAIDRFDPERKVEFRAFAIPTIVGAIKHHLRDRASAIRIPRRVYELAPLVRRREVELSARLARPASPTEVAVEIGVPESAVYDVLAAQAARAPVSIADPSIDDSEHVGDGAADPCDTVADRVTLAASLRTLSPRDRYIVRLRFVDELPQAEIADRLGISQVHVSRLIRAAVGKLRRQLSENEAQAVIHDAA